MALKIRQTPAALQPGRTVEAVWPGDEAVDLSSSDTVAWCRDGSSDGRAGLRFRSGVEPSVITWRPLGPREMMAVSEAAGSGSRTSYPFEAARYGVLSVAGVQLRTERRSGLLGLTDDSLDLLAGEVALLPYLHALASLRSAQGQPEQGAVSDAAAWVSLAEVVGIHILTASFRTRRGGP